MKKKIAFLGATLVSVGMPVFAFAQSLSATCASAQVGGNATGILCTIYKLVNIIIPLLILAAVAFFIFSVVTFIRADGEEKEAARSGMINSIIGFVVILGLWGIVSVVLNTFGVGGQQAPTGAFPTF